MSLLFLKMFKNDFSHGTTSPVILAHVLSKIKSIMLPSFLPSHIFTTSFALSSQNDNSILTPKYNLFCSIYAKKSDLMTKIYKFHPTYIR